MVKVNLCHCNDEYVAVNWRAIEGINANNQTDINLAFKNNSHLLGHANQKPIAHS